MWWIGFFYQIWIIQFRLENINLWKPVKKVSLPTIFSRTWIWGYEKLVLVKITIVTIITCFDSVFCHNIIVCLFPFIKRIILKFA